MTEGRAGRLNRMKVLITGGRGMLGADLTRVFSSRGAEAVPVGGKEADITDAAAVSALVRSVHPDLIIHGAAYTQVDDCEKNKALAFSVNGDGARNVAAAAASVQSPVIYISTDYVFDGTASSPYPESHPVNPINVYGESKLMGERCFSEFDNRYFIVRTSWLYGKSGRNFVDTMRGLMSTGKSPLKVVDDQKGSPTYTVNLAESLFLASSVILNSKIAPSGVYNITGSGECTWFGFASEIAAATGYAGELIPVATAEFPRDAKRPGYSVLDNSLAEKTFGVHMPPWRAALRDYLNSL